MFIISAGATDIGQKRKTNQDAFLVLEDKKLYVVADGMGGHSGGDIASQKAVETFKDFHFQIENSLSPSEFLAHYIKKCNKAIFQKALENPTLKGMGTTITSAFIHENKLYLGNVGDSRTYLFHQKNLFQLTKDHSLVQERVNHGVYTRLAARKDPMKNILIRSVGFEESVEVDTFEYKISKGDFFLLCSDGLYNKLNDEALLKVFQKYFSQMPEDIKGSLTTMVDELIKLANEAGGEDNISVIMLYAKS